MWYYFIVRTDDPNAIVPCLGHAVCANDLASAQNEADSFAASYVDYVYTATNVDYNTYLFGCDTP
jgi:hypothetical protein